MTAGSNELGADLQPMNLLHSVLKLIFLPSPFSHDRDLVKTTGGISQKLVAAATSDGVPTIIECPQNDPCHDPGTSLLDNLI